MDLRENAEMTDTNSYVPYHCSRSPVSVRVSTRSYNSHTPGSTDVVRTISFFRRVGATGMQPAGSGDRVAFSAHRTLQYAVVETMANQARQEAFEFHHLLQIPQVQIVFSYLQTIDTETILPIPYLEALAVFWQCDRDLHRASIEELWHVNLPRVETETILNQTVDNDPIVPHILHCWQAETASRKQRRLRSLRLSYLLLFPNLHQSYGKKRQIPSESELAELVDWLKTQLKNGRFAIRTDIDRQARTYYSHDLVCR